MIAGHLVVVKQKAMVRTEVVMSAHPFITRVRSKRKLYLQPLGSRPCELHDDANVSRLNTHGTRADGVDLCDVGLEVHG